MIERASATCPSRSGPGEGEFLIDKIGTGSKLTPRVPRTDEHVERSTPTTGQVEAAASTAAPSAVDRASPPGRGFAAHPSGVGQTADKVVEHIAESTWDRIASGQLNLGAGFSLTNSDVLAVRLSQRVYRADDPFVVEDPTRQKTTEQLGGRSGAEVSWVCTGGVADARLGLSHSIPVSGVVKVHGGFRVGGTLEYAVRYPHVTDSHRSDTEILERVRISAPLTAARAAELPPGAMFQVAGKGRAQLHGGVSAGIGRSVGSRFGSASAGLSASVGVTGIFRLRMERVGDNRVRMVLSEVRERRRTADAAVDLSVSKAGLKLFADVLGEPDEVAGAPIDLEAQFGAIAGLESRSLAELIEEQGVAALEPAARSYTAFHAGIGRTAVEESVDIASYVLDLDRPEAQRAYERLVRLDDEGAAQLAQQPDSGIKRVACREETESDEHRASLEIIGKKLILFRALSAERTQTLEGDELKTFTNAWYDRSYKGRFTGDKKIRWEGVEVTEGDAPPTRFARLLFEKQDKITRDEEILQFVRFADLLGIEDEGPRQVELPKGGFLRRVVSKADDTDVLVDIYFTDDGLDRIAAATALQIQSASIRVAEALEPELAGLPVDDLEAMELFREYERFGELAESSNNAELQSAYSSQQVRITAGYRERFSGRSLERDLHVLQEAERMMQLFDTLDSSGRGDGWEHLMQRLGEEHGFAYMQPLAVLAQLAGPEETHVRSLSMTGDAVFISSVDGGTLEQA